MKKIKLLSPLLAILVTIVMGCFNKMSEEIQNKTAGMNGSFEVTESGLPVNWLIYSPKTVPTCRFELIIDTTEYKDGKQSLKFLVDECSPDGGFRSPGISQEYDAIPGESYKLSCWIKNDGCKFIIKIGGVSAFEGQTDTVIVSKESINTWKKLEYNYKMPSDFKRIRFDLNILQPGSFWIDDIKIELVNNKNE